MSLRYLFLLAPVWMALGILPAQTPSLPAPPIAEPAEGRFRRFWRPYQDRPVEEISFTNSSRLDSLIRGGNIYLTLNDAIALALENNLDIDLQRYGPRIADTDTLRAEAGGLLRGLTLAVREGPAGVGGPSGSQTQGLSTLQVQPVDTNLSISTQSGLSAGSLIPLYDPVISGSLSLGRHTTPQSSTFISGTNKLITRNDIGNFGVQKGFSSGGTFGMVYDNTRADVNNQRADVNPSVTSALGLTASQPLLRGFGWAINSRFIRIAKNNRRVSDLAFQQQLIATVSATVRLYWDLVSLNEDVKVRRQTLALSEKLLENNRQQVEAGTLAQIEIVRARAETAGAQRDVTVGDTLVRQQETILKDFLTKSVAADPLLAAARIVPTDTITFPEHEPVEPIQDLISRAFQSRPDLLQAHIQLDNSQISLKGSKSNLLPQLDLVASATSNALYGSVNGLPPIGSTVPNGGTGATGTGNTGTGTGTTATILRTPDPGLIGGLGTGLSQIFTGKFPDYSLGVQLSIPIGNRQAIADLVRDKLTVRQQEIRLHQLEKQVQVDIQNAVIAVEQSRASYQASEQQRILQEQALDAEQQKYSVGLSTNYLVIQYQRDLAQSRSTEVAALGTYIKAKASLDRALGTILQSHGVSIEDAYRGVVK